MDVSKGVIQVNEYRLSGGVEPFVAAIAALAQRTESEGHPGVKGYRWYCDESAGTAGAVILYEDSASWVGHHELAYQWNEMAALQASVSLQRLTVFGPLGDDVKTWLDGAGLSYSHYDTWTAGF